MSFPPPGSIMAALEILGTPRDVDTDGARWRAYSKAGLSHNVTEPGRMGELWGGHQAADKHQTLAGSTWLAADLALGLPATPYFRAIFSSRGLR